MLIGIISYLTRMEIAMTFMLNAISAEQVRLDTTLLKKQRKHGTGGLTMADCNNAVIYITERERMCHLEKCADCPLFPDNTGIGMWCDSFEERHPAESVAAVQRWSDEHPKEGE